MTFKENKGIRLDYKVIMDLIEPQSRILDLGCGDGELLCLLQDKKFCRVEGIEINEESVYKCLEKELTVCHEDINVALANYPNHRFDYVILNESIQEVLQLKKTILETLRIGKQVIVGVPNFCQLFARLQLFFKGKVPVTQELPHQWYDTPNLRFFSLKDFRNFCRESQITIVKERDLGLSREVHFLPNILAHFGVFVLKK